MPRLKPGMLLILTGFAVLAGGVPTSFALDRLWLATFDFQLILTLSLLNTFLTLSGLILIPLGVRRVRRPSTGSLTIDIL
ncbi:MAG: hypothetical protein V3U17_02290 [Thermoplasmata archaeon]